MPLAHDGRMSLPPGFAYRAATFDATASALHLTGLLAELAWEEQQFTIFGRRTPMPRLIAMYGPVGYRYSGVVHPPQPFPARLDAIRAGVEPITFAMPPSITIVWPVM